MKAILKQKQILGDKDILYTFECPTIASKAKPGQFVEIKIRDGVYPFLRRPISIFDTDEKEVKLLVRAVGAGTRIMETWDVGKEVDLLGPLGKGFQIDENTKKVLLIGGGIGVAPLHLLAKVLLEKGKNVSMIFLPKRDAVVMESMNDIIETIDITYGENRKALSEILDSKLSCPSVFDTVYTCGPNAMMSNVVKRCMENKISCQVSMEERMGCGIGLCVGCVVPIKTTDGFEYKKACKDGPVFLGEEVLFDE